jgi:hypothetical protein
MLWEKRIAMVAAALAVACVTIKVRADEPSNDWQIGDVRHETVECTKFGPVVTFHVWGDTTWVYTEDGWVITSVFTNVGLTGLTVGVDLTDQWSYYEILAPNGVRIKGGGILREYVGPYNWLSVPVDCWAEQWFGAGSSA